MRTWARRHLGRIRSGHDGRRRPRRKQAHSTSRVRSSRRAWSWAAVNCACRVWILSTIMMSRSNTSSRNSNNSSSGRLQSRRKAQVFLSDAWCAAGRGSLPTNTCSAASIIGYHGFPSRGMSRFARGCTTDCRWACLCVVGT